MSKSIKAIPIPNRIPEVVSPVLDATYALESRRLSLILFDTYNIMADSLKSLALFRPMNRIVEIGCNNGDFAKAIALKFPKASVFGEDIDADVIDYARTYNSAPNLDYRVGSAYNLSDRHKGVDCVVTKDVLHHLDDLDAVFSEVRDSLKPNGAFVSWDLDRKKFYDTICLDKPAIFRAVQEYKDKKKRTTSDIVDHINSLGCVGNVIMSYAAAYTFDEVKSALDRTGFMLLSSDSVGQAGFQFSACKR